MGGGGGCFLVKEENKGYILSAEYKAIVENHSFEFVSSSQVKYMYM